MTRKSTLSETTQKLAAGAAAPASGAGDGGCDQDGEGVLGNMIGAILSERERVLLYEYITQPYSNHLSSVERFTLLISCCIKHWLRKYQLLTQICKHAHARFCYYSLLILYHLLSCLIRKHKKILPEQIAVSIDRC